MEQKRVKIVGLSVNKNFGGLKATELTFDEDNRLTLVKGEVGSGKTTLNRAMSLTTKGSKTLEDKKLYGDDVDLTAQLIDGDHSVFVNCKSQKDGSLAQTIYTVDKDGNKLKDVVIDGKKLTPANYLKSLQTALTWRLDELTSENPTVQRNILLELYEVELQKRGVIFDKKHPKYVGSIIDKIEKAKSKRDYADMKRKEVGGIADDLKKKGVPTEQRMEIHDLEALKKSISNKEAEINLAKTNASQLAQNKLTEIKNKGLTLAAELRALNDKIKRINAAIDQKETEYESKQRERLQLIAQAVGIFNQLGIDADSLEKLEETVIEKSPSPKKPTRTRLKELEFNQENKCTSKASDFKGKAAELLKQYAGVAVEYVKASKQTEAEKPDTRKQENELELLKKELKKKEAHNEDAKAVNALFDWREANQEVKEIQKDYYLKLSGIDTGIEGLHIVPEYDTNKKGEKMAKGNDIYLMYDGSYDPEYFHNKQKELRKISAYSDTQKPMICLLIQNYLLSKKPKVLPYLWIDKVPIDDKTKQLIERMSEELGLWLFVSWTGDFDHETLKDGELLIENGEVFFKD